MATKDTPVPAGTWMTDGYGNVAFANSAEQDNLLLRGWKAEKEQPATGQVWVFHEASGNHAQMPTGVLGEFALLGWLPSTAPAEPDLTKDPRYTEQPASAGTLKEN